MTDTKEAYHAVEKSSSDLIDLLSAGVVGLHVFGQALVKAEFLKNSALNDILGITATSEKAWKLSLVVTTQVEHNPNKYFKAYLSVLEKFPSLGTVLQEINNNVPEEASSTTLQVNTGLGTSHLQIKQVRTGETSSSATAGSTNANLPNNMELKFKKLSLKENVMQEDKRVKQDIGIESTKMLHDKHQKINEYESSISVPADDAMISKCSAEGPGIKSAEANSTTFFTVSVKDHLDKPRTHPYQLTTTLQSLVDGSVVETTHTCKDDATYEVQYTATQRGRHQLNVAVNGVEIHGSPFAIFVNIPPTQLGAPVQVIEGLKKPYCIAINIDSELVVSEKDCRKISVYTRRGEKKHEFESQGKEKGEFKSPTGVAVDKSDGSIFVADEDNHCIQKFTREGRLTKLVGGPTCGSGPMQFKKPNSLKLHNNKLYVCDTENYRIQVFDTELNYISSIGGGWGSGRGQFKEPKDVSFDDSSMLHVTDPYNSRIQVLDQDGKYIQEYGQSVQRKWQPCYIHIDHGYVYVSEIHSLYVFTTSGELVHTIGGCGSGSGGLEYPIGVAVDTDGFVCVCDKGCVKIF